MHVKNPSFIRAQHWYRATVRGYGLVQDGAAIESLRRFLVILWLFVPLEIALTVWFALYQPALDSATVAWARSLYLVHGFTAAFTLLLAIAVFNLLRRSHLSTRGATVLQVVLCATYLVYGVLISFIDLKVGAGISAFILISIGVGGLSLMRPAISAPLYLVTLAIFSRILSLTSQTDSVVSSLRINSAAAIVLALVLSTIIWHQYAKGVLLRRELEMLAGQDPLTGLPNRRLLLDRLRHAIAASARWEQKGALLFIDLDNFKSLNDTQGHEVGDLLLKAVAERLKRCIRECDTVARLGGDEFVVMLEDLSSDAVEAANLAENVSAKILATLNQPYAVGDGDHRSTPSIGVTIFSGNDQSTEELMKRADLAMYQAKAHGRNGVRFYDPDMQARVLARVTLENDLRQGIQQRQFRLHYQPQVDAVACVVGVEALIRWHQPERGWVSPADFIGLAEETGLIVPLGGWVVEQACLQLATWAGQPSMTHLTIAVNISVYQFRQRNFVGDVLDALRSTGARGDRLKLELTESLLVSNVEEIIEKMNALKEHGVTFALDDFGTGYSSLSYLKRLPLDQLKIDQSFVRDVLDDPNDAAIARTIIALGKSLGLSVIAEGVETQAQRDLLFDADCHFYQGYFYAKPLPLAEFEQFQASLSATSAPASAVALR